MKDVYSIIEIMPMDLDVWEQGAGEALSTALEFAALVLGDVESGGVTVIHVQWSFEQLDDEGEVRCGYSFGGWLVDIRMRRSDERYVVLLHGVSHEVLATARGGRDALRRLEAVARDTESTE